MEDNNNLKQSRFDIKKLLHDGILDCKSGYKIDYMREIRESIERKIDRKNNYFKINFIIYLYYK